MITVAMSSEAIVKEERQEWKREQYCLEEEARSPEPMESCLMVEPHIKYKHEITESWNTSAIMPGETPVKQELKDHEGLCNNNSGDFNPIITGTTVLKIERMSEAEMQSPFSESCTSPQRRESSESFTSPCHNATEPSNDLDDKIAKAENNTLACKHCNSMFISEHFLRKHMAALSKEHILKVDSSYCCCKCPQKFTSKMDLEAHLKLQRLHRKRKTDATRQNVYRKNQSSEEVKIRKAAAAAYMREYRIRKSKSDSSSPTEARRKHDDAKHGRLTDIGDSEVERGSAVEVDERMNIKRSLAASRSRNYRARKRLKQQKGES